MLYTHTIGRIGKDCKVITGVHGTFMAVDVAVDDYSKGQNITTWVRVGKADSRGGNDLHVPVDGQAGREPCAGEHQRGQHRFRERRTQGGAVCQPEAGFQERSKGEEEHARTAKGCTRGQG